MLLKLGKVLHGMQNKKKDERGFTLIELLVVVIIIGILAAIAIPVFLAQRDNAREATAQSDLRNLSSAITAYAADNDGSIDPNPTYADLQALGFNRSDDVHIVVTVASDNASYNATAQHIDGGSQYSFTSGTTAFNGVNPGQVGESTSTPTAPTTAAFNIS